MKNKNTFNTTVYFRSVVDTVALNKAGNTRPPTNYIIIMKLLNVSQAASITDALVQRLNDLHRFFLGICRIWAERFVAYISILTNHMYKVHIESKSWNALTENICNGFLFIHMQKAVNRDMPKMS